MQQLSERLQALFDLVPAGGTVCDVGTDHGYLAAALRLSGKATAVTATDLRQKPLANAENHFAACGVQGVRLLLTDGLCGVTRAEADTVVIAGMGGEVISGILARSDFAKDGSVLWLLQPMTSAAELRRFLAENGYETVKETAVLENGRPYAILSVRYTGVCRAIGAAEERVGKLATDTPAERRYFEKQLRLTETLAASLATVAGKEFQATALRETARELRRRLEDVHGT